MANLQLYVGQHMPVILIKQLVIKLESHIY